MPLLFRRHIHHGVVSANVLGRIVVLRHDIWKLIQLVAYILLPLFSKEVGIPLSLRQVHVEGVEGRCNFIPNLGDVRYFLECDSNRPLNVIGEERIKLHVKPAPPIVRVQTEASDRIVDPLKEGFAVLVGVVHVVFVSFGGLLKLSELVSGSVDHCVELCHSLVNQLVCRVKKRAIRAVLRVTCCHTRHKLVDIGEKGIEGDVQIEAWKVYEIDPLLKVILHVLRLIVGILGIVSSPQHNVVGKPRHSRLGLLAVLSRKSESFAPHRRNVTYLVIYLFLVLGTAGRQVRQGNPVLGPTL
mmetsp:Transcript_13174/g.26859  ORF Transcript_13174/g.26859 Transcript_13174/m.26859 type:complete len:299 (-) Transcript_13174:605-1501(-)